MAGGSGYRRSGRAGARRLLPALLLLLVVLVVFARNATPRADVLGALAYVANWQQIWTDASYFSAFAEPSPLKHVWSLAVEEQFYLLWPVVVLAALRIGGRRALIALCTGGILVSVLLMAVWYAPTDPSRVYYGTDTRAHLLLVGALLALVPAERLRVASSARGQVLGALALAIGVGAMLVVDDQSAFLYRGGMFLNALLVAGVLASVAYQPGTRLARALGVAPLRGLGGISYGVYLWSWPVIVLVTTDRTGLDGAALVALQLALIITVPLLSYRLLEQPVRRWRPRPVPVLAGALAAAVAMGVAAVVVVPKPALDPVFATAGPDLADFEPVAAPPVTAPPVTAPPVTAPPVTAGPPATVAPPATEPNPTTTVALRALRPPHRIAIVGDSVAASLAFGFDAVAREFGIEVVKRAYPGCGVAVAIPLGQDGKRVEWGEACANVGAVLDDLVARRDPDVVVWLSTLDTVDREENGVPLQWGTDEHRAALLAAMDAQVARLTSRGARRRVHRTALSGARSVESAAAGKGSTDPARLPRAAHRLYDRQRRPQRVRGNRRPRVPDRVPVPAGGRRHRPPTRRHALQRGERTDHRPSAAAASSGNGRGLAFAAVVSEPAGRGCAAPRCSCSPASCRRRW